MNLYALYIDQQDDKEMTVQDMFGPLALLPTQLENRHSFHKLPEFRIAYALMEQTIYDIKLTVTNPRSPFMCNGNRKHVENWREWINGKSEDFDYSFDHVCEILGIDADSLRSILYRWIENRCRPLSNSKKAA